MIFRTYYIFYGLAIFLIVFGFVTKDLVILPGTWESISVKGMWTFFIPAALLALATALLYQYFDKSGRRLNRIFIVFHFLLFTTGLIFSLNAYQIITIMLTLGAPDLAAIATQDSFLKITFGPIMLLASLLLFTIQLIRTKRVTT